MAVPPYFHDIVLCTRITGNMRKRSEIFGTCYEKRKRESVFHGKVPGNGARGGLKEKYADRIVRVTRGGYTTGHWLQCQKIRQV